MTKSITNNNTATQRAKILTYLKQHRTATTLEIRQILGIPHAAGRVQELRSRGYHILTAWQIDADSTGESHCVAQYILMSSAKEAV